MFEFTDLDGMSRLLLLKKQKDAKDYWKQMFHLKGALIAFSSGAIALVVAYKASGGVSDLTKAVDAAAIKGEITLKRVENQILRVDAYLKDIDVRLADGTKWYNAQEIQEMFDSIEGE